MLKQVLSRAAWPAVIIPTAGFAYQYQNDEGTRRSLKFWGNIFPVFAHYRFYQLLSRDLGIISMEEADQKYLELHEKYTDKVRDITFEMRGFYLKQAQLMSTQDDFVPAAYMKWVKKTQDDVPSEFEGDGARVYTAKVMKEELGLDFDEVFSNWDDKPIGVASIGEVHFATLRSTGEKVAVKILVPNIEQKFRADIHTMKSFCQLAMPQHVTAFEEIERQFTTEFDYSREASNLALIRNAMFPKWEDVIRIPRPHEELCSKHLLVMEYLDGVKLVDGIRAKLGKVAKLAGKTVEELEAEQLAAMREGNFQFKSINDSKQERERLEWQLFVRDCMDAANVRRFVYNNTAGWLFGTVPYERTEAPVDLGRVIEILAEVHGNQIFEHGVFNGDPHPGNILLCSDGKLGLIDYGQVKTMTEEQRINFAQLILAHARYDVDEVVRLHFDVIGTKTRYRKEDIGYKMSAFYNDRDTPDVTHGLSIASFIDYLEAQDPMVKLPEDYIFASRVSIMVRGMGKAFGLQLRMAPLWETEAATLLKKRNIPVSYSPSFLKHQQQPPQATKEQYLTNVTESLREVERDLQQMNVHVHKK